jgi:hypothetical protein
VFWREIDLSNYIPTLSSTQVGIVTTATKGPINDKELITNKDQLVKMFGYPSMPHYGLYAALQYLEEGNQCWIIRAESEASPCTYATVDLVDIHGDPIVFRSLTPGTFYNTMNIEVDHASPSRHIGYDYDLALATGDVDGPWSITVDVGKEILVPETFTLSIDGTVAVKDNGLGVLIPAVIGNGYSGTINYKEGTAVLTSTIVDIRTKVATIKTMFNTSFTLIVYKTIERKRYVLEEFKNLSLDLDNEKYYKNVIKKSFIFDTFDTEVIPASGSYPFSGGSDGLENIDASDYIGTYLGNKKTGLQIFGSPDEIDLNAIAIPGISNDAVVQALVSMAETRKDCIALLDCPAGFTPEDVADWANGINEFSDRNAVNSSYAAIYYPWVKMLDTYNDKEIFVPPSGFVMAAFAAVDRTYDVWWAPAGHNLGPIKNTIGVERSLTRGEMDFLYENRINPVVNPSHQGIMLYGQKTTQIYATARDRINVRRLLIYIEKVITTSMMPFVFKPAHNHTYKQVTDMIQPYLDGLVGRGALYEGVCVCNDVINTPEVINRNEMIVNIFLKPVKSAEIITLNFVIVETGANIQELTGRQFS